jgi:small subunit ribosomal protein S4
MSRYTGSTWRKSRRLKFSILETGEELQRRPQIPGQHGEKNEKVKLSEYGKQLQEKQKVRFMYGVSEKQFRRLYQLAKKSDEVTGYAFLKILESRLDNMVYRMGMARTRQGARQLVNHGHITVNGKKVDIASYLTKVGDVIALKETSKNLKVVAESLDSIRSTAAWVSFNKETKEGKVERFPERNELNTEINESLVVEYYNRLD